MVIGGLLDCPNPALPFANPGVREEGVVDDDNGEEEELGEWDPMEERERRTDAGSRFPKEFRFASREEEEEDWEVGNAKGWDSKKNKAVSCWSFLGRREDITYPQPQR